MRPDDVADSDDPHVELTGLTIRQKLVCQTTCCMTQSGTPNKLALQVITCTSRVSCIKATRFLFSRFSPYIKVYENDVSIFSEQLGSRTGPIYLTGFMVHNNAGVYGCYR